MTPAGSAVRWAVGGAAIGALWALVACAPAGWVAGALARATGDRVLLADARGTVWRGSAVMVLTGGAGSRDASALPGRIEWTLALDGAALALRARHACCINGELALRLVPGLSRLRVELPPRADTAQAIGQWPAAWLAGLGTPWNTLQPTGALLLKSRGLAVEQVQGRWLFDGSAELDIDSLASRVSTLSELGSYRLTLTGDAGRADAAQVRLTTRSGALQLSGSGSLLGAGSAASLRFQGQASAAPGSQDVLANLLNIIGRRQGAVSVISIG